MGRLPWDGPVPEMAVRWASRWRLKSRLHSCQFKRIAPESTLWSVRSGSTLVTLCTSSGDYHFYNFHCFLQLLADCIFGYPNMGEDFRLKVVETCLHQSGDCHTTGTSKVRVSESLMKILDGPSFTCLVRNKVGTATSVSTSKNRTRKRLSMSLKVLMVSA